MKLTPVKIHFQAFGVMHTETTEARPDFDIKTAEKFIRNKLKCDTAIVYSIEINGEVLLNEAHEAFRVVGKVSEKLIRNK